MLDTLRTLYTGMRLRPDAKFSTNSNPLLESLLGKLGLAQAFSHGGTSVVWLQVKMTMTLNFTF